MKSIIIVLFTVITLITAACSRGGGSESNNKYVINLHSEKDFDNIISENNLVLVDFHAEWCRPCKVQSPILDELATEMDGKLIVLKVDVDIYGNLASRFQITGIPALILYSSGKPVWEAAGLQQKSELKGLINIHI